VCASIKPLGKPGKVEVKSGKSGDLLLIAIITLFEERELLPAYGKAPFPKHYPKQMGKGDILC